MIRGAVPAALEDPMTTTEQAAPALVVAHEASPTLAYDLTDRKSVV